MFLQSIFVLCVHETAADPDSVEFVFTDAAEKYLLASRTDIEIPHSISLHDRNWKRPVIISYDELSAAGILRIRYYRLFFARQCRKLGSSVLVQDGIFRNHEILAIRSKKLYKGGDIIISRGLDKRLGSLLWRRERFLCRFLVGLGCGV